VLCFDCRPHRCPEPLGRLSAPLSITSRLMNRSVSYLCVGGWVCAFTIYNEKRYKYEMRTLLVEAKTVPISELFLKKGGSSSVTISFWDQQRSLYFKFQVSMLLLEVFHRMSRFLMAATVFTGFIVHILLLLLLLLFLRSLSVCIKMMLQILPPYGGADGARLDRKLFYSRFTPCNTYRDKDATDTFASCCFSVSVALWHWIRFFCVMSNEPTICG
jgi:hypothetical protein